MPLYHNEERQESELQQEEVPQSSEDMRGEVPTLPLRKNDHATHRYNRPLSRVQRLRYEY